MRHLILLPHRQAGDWDAAHEAFIQHCGQLMESAMRAGDKSSALFWMQAEFRAITLRSDAQQERMQNAIDDAGEGA
jgi:hypothetical protein